MHLSGSVIATIGGDRYHRIKCYVKFKTISSTKILLIFICSESFLAFFQAIMITAGLELELDRFVVSVYFTMDIVVVVMVIILQVKTIRTSRDVHNMLTVATSEKSTRKSQS